MALAPKFAGHRLLFAPPDQTAAVAGTPLHTIEVFLDYVCPFSAKMLHTLTREVRPRLSEDGAVAGRVQVLLRQQVQPWHPSSTLAHEAALAVERLAPDRFWAFSEALMAAQRDYFDVAVAAEGRNATYRRLAALAASSVGVDADEVYALLAIPDKPGEDGALNVGNRITDDFKVHIKMARLVGVHASPTVLFDGVVDNEISSSWSADQWVEWVKKNVS